MTLDEAIEHASEVADGCGECAEDHRQLAEWLKELRQWQKLAEGIDLRPNSLMNTFQPKDLERENAKLRELVKNMYGWLVVNYEKSYVIPLNGLNDIERDMRELGIEVEE